MILTTAHMQIPRRLFWSQLSIHHERFSEALSLQSAGCLLAVAMGLGFMIGDRHKGSCKVTACGRSLHKHGMGIGL